MTFAIALAAIVVDVFLRLRAGDGFWRSHRYGWLHSVGQEPAILFFLLIGLAASLGLSYRAREWDEFSHWLLMPRQMAVVDRFLSKQFLFDWLATYTPGWPTMALYPQLLLRGEFSEQGAWLAPIMSAGFFLMTFASVVRVEVQTRSAQWAVLAITFLLPLGASFFKPTLLIENPGMHIFGLSILLMYEATSGRLHSRSAAIVLGLMIGVAYLLKKPFVVLLPGVLYFFWLLKPLPDQGDGRAALKAGFRTTGALLLPLLLVYLLWREATGSFVDLWSVAGAPGAKNWTPDRWWAAPRMFWNLIKYEPLLILSFAASLYVGKRDPVIRKVSLAALLLFAVYFVGLGYLYIFSFGAYEGPRLVSFRRYIELVALPIQGWIWLALLVRHCSAANKANQISSHLHNQLLTQLPSQMIYQRAFDHLKRLVSPQKFPFLISVVSLIGFVVCAHAAFGKMWKERATFEVDAAGNFASFLTLSATTKAAIGGQKSPPRVLLIAQDDDGRAMAKFRYALAGTQGSWDESQRPVIEGDWSYATTPSNVWTRGVSNENFADLIKRVDYIWVYRANRWLEERLLPFIDAQTCPDGPDGSMVGADAATSRSSKLSGGMILIRSSDTANHQFLCVGAVGGGAG